MVGKYICLTLFVLGNPHLELAVRGKLLTNTDYEKFVNEDYLFDNV